MPELEGEQPPLDFGQSLDHQVVLSDDKDSTPFRPQEVAVESLSSSSISETTLVIYLVREEDVCSLWATEEDGVDPLWMWDALTIKVKMFVA